MPKTFILELLECSINPKENQAHISFNLTMKVPAEVLLKLVINELSKEDIVLLLSSALPIREGSACHKP